MPFTSAPASRERKNYNEGSEKYEGGVRRDAISIEDALRGKKICAIKFVAIAREAGRIEIAARHKNRKMNQQP